MELSKTEPETPHPNKVATFFKRKVLTDRQLWKVKFTTVFVLCAVAYSVVMDHVQANYLDNSGTFEWRGETFTRQSITDYKTGQIVEFGTDSREEFCHSFILTPGFQLQKSWYLAAVYIIFLVWIFVGVAIISDIFMDSITVITSAKRIV